MILNKFSLLDFYEPNIILKLSSQGIRFLQQLFDRTILKRTSRELFYKLYSDKRKLLENVIKIQKI